MDKKLYTDFEDFCTQVQEAILRARFFQLLNMSSFGE